jgi:hypothetical protein
VVAFESGNIFCKSNGKGLTNSSPIVFFINYVEWSIIFSGLRAFKSKNLYISPKFSKIAGNIYKEGF